MREAELQAMVMQTAALYGVLAHHQTISLRSEPGLPDCLLVGSNGIMYRELKVGRNKLSEHQKYWLAALTEAGVDACEWRDTDWPDRIVREIKSLGRLKTPKPAPRMPSPRKSSTNARSRGGYKNPYARR